VFYSMIVIADQQGKQGMYYFLRTDNGPLVILFEDLEKMDIVSEYITLEPGNKFMAAQGDFASIEEAARAIKEGSPHLHEAMFVTDSDPLVTQIIAALKAGDLRL
jgi:hypothetical protein